MNLTTLVALAVFGTTTAMAQTLPNQLPQTVTLKNEKGEIIGTATSSYNMTVFRNASGELMFSSRIENGVMTFYDPHGKVLRTVINKGNEFIIHNGTGDVIGSTTIDRNGTASYFDPTGKLLGTSKPRE